MASGCSAQRSDGDPTTADAARVGQAGDNPAAMQCPAGPITRSVAPDVASRHRNAETWLAMLPASAADEVLVDPAGVADLNAHFATIQGAYRDPLSEAVGDPAAVAEEIAERTAWMHARVEQGQYVQAQPGSMAAAQAIVGRAVAVDEVRLVVDEAALWCVPLDTGLFKPPADPSFDRNRCASLHPSEMVRVLRRDEGAAPGDVWVYVNAGHTTGWLHAPSLTPALPIEHVRPLWSGPQLLPLSDTVTTVDGQRIRLGTHVPLRGQDDEGYRVLVAGASGPTPARVARSAEVSVGPRALSRRALWTMALAELDQPYGWGGTQGARDCSRFLRDLLVSFGIELARHSGVQAKLGTETIDVSGMAEPAKRQALAAAAARGIVLLYMPGHIMLYLGRDGGHDYAVSAISEWLEPCPGGPDTVYRLDRVAVTTLALGRDTERTAYIERITTLVLFAPP